MSIDLELSQEQELIRKTAADFFARTCPIPRVRELEASELGYDPQIWRQMGELDWIALAWPEKWGGANGTLLDLYPLYLEMGRAIVPSPHLSSAVIAGETLVRSGSDAQRARLLPHMARGECVVAPALLEARGDWGPEGIELDAAAEGSGFRLQGAKILVPYAHVADEILVAARTSRGADGVTLLLVERRTGGVKVERLPNIAGYPLCAVSFDGVRVGRDAVVGEPDRGWAALLPALDRAAVLQCAEIIGAGEKVLEIAVEYAKDRQQFGQPIGRYQAVQYLCSDIAIAGHLGSLLARQAAWRIDAGLPARREVSLAKAHASDSAQLMVRQAQEVLAGAAFMLENDLQLYTRRAKHWEFNLGDSRWHRDAAITAIEERSQQRQLARHA
jgi:alkylation response protein AidB-like acyl-CoA dehydrogenase